MRAYIHACVSCGSVLLSMNCEGVHIIRVCCGCEYVSCSAGLGMLWVLVHVSSWGRMCKKLFCMDFAFAVDRAYA